MMSLYDRLAEVVVTWAAADEFTDEEFKGYLSALQEAVKDWMLDGAHSISREG